METTWAELDTVNSREGHYRRQPGFYVRAKMAEQRAFDARNAALDAWLDTPEWQEGTRRKKWMAFQAADEAWIGTRAATNAAYNHWQTLLRWQNEPCTCLPEGDACHHCQAEARLKDWEYEPHELL
jgi:hypothetical protein